MGWNLQHIRIYKWQHQRPHPLFSFVAVAAVDLTGCNLPSSCQAGGDRLGVDMSVAIKASFEDKTDR